jgi:hypothetical protein
VDCLGLTKDQLSQLIHVSRDTIPLRVFLCVRAPHSVSILEKHFCRFCGSLILFPSFRSIFVGVLSPSFHCLPYGAFLSVLWVPHSASFLEEHFCVCCGSLILFPSLRSISAGVASPSFYFFFWRWFRWRLQVSIFFFLPWRDFLWVLQFMSVVRDLIIHQYTHNHQLFSVFFNIFHMLNFSGL